MILIIDFEVAPIDYKGDCVIRIEGLYTQYILYVSLHQIAPHLTLGLNLPHRNKDM